MQSRPAIAERAGYLSGHKRFHPIRRIEGVEVALYQL
jgi:hypothetical protein